MKCGENLAHRIEDWYTLDEHQRFISEHVAVAAIAGGRWFDYRLSAAVAFADISSGPGAEELKVYASLFSLASN